MRRFLIAVASAISLCSCASVSVKNLDRASGQKTGRPSKILVAPFEVVAAGVKENPARKNPGKLGIEGQALLQAYLVDDIRKLGVAAETTNKATSSAKTWVITGQITRLAEGNRLLRMAIGLGSGGTKFETQVNVRAAECTILHFGTTGGSNAMPGGATNPIPFSSLPTALLRAQDGVTDDAARTARMITGTIGHYMVERGWIAPEKVPVVKMAHP